MSGPGAEAQNHFGHNSPTNFAKALSVLLSFGFGQHVKPERSLRPVGIYGFQFSTGTGIQGSKPRTRAIDSPDGNATECPRYRSRPASELNSGLCVCPTRASGNLIREGTSRGPILRLGCGRC